MTYLTPTFGEEFRLAADGEMLAVDFWSYLNARQARLPLDADSNPLWDCIEELEREVEPLLDRRTPESATDFLASISRQWMAQAQARPSMLRSQVRMEASTMLRDALAHSQTRHTLEER
jgi:hypothetical protein